MRVLMLCALITAACAAQVDSRVTREEVSSAYLSYRLNVDSTRLRKGSGLPAVDAVMQLVEDGLSRFFRVGPRTSRGSSTELIGEAAALGYGVRATVERRPDDFCLITLDAVQLRDGGAVSTTAAPYSVHFGLAAVRTALQTLQTPAWPSMTEATFEILRKQASELAAAGQDPPIDEATFAHTPRPLQRADEPPHYYAPKTNSRE